MDCRVRPGKHSGASPSAVSGKPNGHVKQVNVVSDLSQIGNMVLTVRLATNLTSAWKHATLHTALETTEAQRNTHAAATTQVSLKQPPQELSALELLSHHQSDKIRASHLRGGFLPMQENGVPTHAGFTSKPLIQNLKRKIE